MAKITDELSVFEVPELERTREGIPRLFLSHDRNTLPEIPENQREKREIFLPLSKLMVSATYKKDTRQAQQQSDSLYYPECCSTPFRGLFPRSHASEKYKNRTSGTDTAGTYFWPQKVTLMRCNYKPSLNAEL